MTPPPHGPACGNVTQGGCLRRTGRALLPVAEHPRPRREALRYGSNPALCVLVPKGLLPRALRQVALVSFLLPTCGDSRPELHAPRNNGTSGAQKRKEAPPGLG